MLMGKKKKNEEYAWGPQMFGNSKRTRQEGNHDLNRSRLGELRRQ